MGHKRYLLPKGVEDIIIELRTQGIFYKDIIKYLKETYNIDMTYYSAVYYGNPKRNIKKATRSRERRKDRNERFNKSEFYKLRNNVIKATTDLCRFCEDKMIALEKLEK